MSIIWQMPNQRFCSLGDLMFRGFSYGGSAKIAATFQIYTTA